tara:strand:- start:89 stop:340 length:252 start_codon:yes stop_codon:yes gene_type:complete
VTRIRPKKQNSSKNTTAAHKIGGISKMDSKISEKESSSDGTPTLGTTPTRSSANSASMDPNSKQKTVQQSSFSSKARQQYQQY